MNLIKNKIFLFFIFTLTIIGCAKPLVDYQFSKANATLKFNENTQINFSNSAKYKDWLSPCVLDGYTIFDKNTNYGQIFMESISLTSQCTWRGLSLSAFELNFKRELRIKTMELVENIDVDNFTSFRTYKVNGDSYLSLIYKTDVSSDRFILDYEGRLYTKLLSTYTKDYEDKFSDKKRFSTIYNHSLVEKNFVYQYFHREREYIKP